MGGEIVNDNWLKNNTNWNKGLPNFMGDDFFSEFKNLMFDNNGPKVNIYESGNEILVIFSLPGLKMEDIDIYAHEKTLEVRCTIHTDYQGFRLIQDEILQGPVKRTIELPYPIRDDKVDASYQRGLLSIYLHRLIRTNNIKNKIKVKNLEED